MSSHNQKEVYYRQIGDIPNSDTEPFIIIPNRISRSDISHIQRALSNKKTKQLYLTDINNERLKELDLKENTDEIFLHDFQNSSSEDLKSLIKNQISKGQVVIFLPGSYNVPKGANFHFPSKQIKKILELELPIIPLFIEKLSETKLSIENNDTTVHSYGKAIESENLNLAAFQESLLIAGEKAFNSHKIFEDSLAFSLLKGLKLNAEKTDI